MTPMGVGGKRFLDCCAISDARSPFMNRLAVVAVLLILAMNDSASADAAARATNEDAAQTDPSPAPAPENPRGLEQTSFYHDAAADRDPSESTNRTIFAGNRFVDNHVLKPVAEP